MSGISYKAYFPVGIVARPHGLHGEVRIHARLSDPGVLRRVRVIRATFPDGRTEELEVDGTRIEGPKVWLHFRNIDDRNGAEHLRGAELVVARSNLPPLAEGEYFLGDLVGYTVVTENGKEVGPVTEALDLPANDVLQVRHDGREVLIPLVEEVVRDIDHARGRLTVALMEGLLD